jgi:glycerol-3-phosphate O-acyltransferase/dihydroxyacetone phosphate acyltransferase
VKIAGRDVLATWKLLVGLVLIPTLYGFYGFLVFLSLLQTSLELKWKLIIPLASMVFISAMSYASLQFGEIGMDIARLVCLYKVIFRIILTTTSSHLLWQIATTSGDGFIGP